TPNRPAESRVADPHENALNPPRPRTEPIRCAPSPRRTRPAIVRYVGKGARMSQRQQFKGRSAFIFAAIGSAVGLGNIWRFPYVAYEGGGGAFIIPYLTALLTAGIPLLFLLYAIGHKYRGSAPLSFRRLNPGTEVIGWWQVGISF